MREREEGGTGWIGEWDEGERRGRVWNDGGVGCGREELAGLDGSENGMSEREGDVAAWIGEWDEGERRGQGWMDAGVG